jgi:hypothetical protein
MVKNIKLIQCTNIGPIRQHTRSKFEVDTSSDSKVMTSCVKNTYTLTDGKRRWIGCTLT